MTIIAYWKFDDGSGTSATDSSGNNLTGTLSGTTTPTWTTGFVVGALNFSDGAVLIGTPSILNISSAMTVACWISKTSYSGSNETILDSGYDPSSTTEKYYFRFNNSTTMEWGSYNGGTNSVTATTSIPTDGSWHHVCATYDGVNAWTIYVDGVSVNSATPGGMFTASNWSSAFDVSIGGWYASQAYNHRGFNGKIDEFIIYNTLLTSTDVLNLYNSYFQKLSWVQPPDLLKHPSMLDTNQSYNWITPTWRTEQKLGGGLLLDLWTLTTKQKVTTVYDTPGPFLWSQPPDLLNHPKHLDTNQSLSIWGGFLDTTPTAWWWSQPREFPWHPPHLDTNQPQLTAAYNNATAAPQQFWWSQPPDLQHLTPAISSPFWTLPDAGILPFATPTAQWWSQPPDLLHHPTHLDTNFWTLPFGGISASATSTAQWWSQPPDMLRHWPTLDTNQGADYWTGNSVATNVTPGVFWLFQPSDLLNHPATLWTPPLPNAFFPWTPGQTPDAFGSWTIFPDLQRHAPELWTPAAYWPPLADIAPGFEPAIQWWSQPPDLFRHPPHLDTNFAWFEQIAAAGETGVWWWAEPPDLLRHAAHLDTNQPRLVAQQWATPQQWWWSQPPDLLRHPSHLDTNLLTMPFAGLAAFAPPSAFWWSQPPDFLWHPAHLDTNEPRLVAQQWAEPAVWWWTQSPDLLRHPPHLDTNQGLMLWYPAIPITPGALWWSQPPDLLRHAAHLDTNQGLDLWYAPLSFVAALTPAQFWWSQPPDLLRHPPHLDTNEPQLTFAALNAFATPSARWWSQPPDILRHVPELWTPEPWNPPLYAQTSTAQWWMQPPDIFRHAAHLDTNFWTLPLAGLEAFAEPNLWWWTEPPTLLLKPPDLLQIQPFNEQWQLVLPGRLQTLAPQFMGPPVPTLLSIEPYVARGDTFWPSATLLAPPSFPPPTGASFTPSTRFTITPPPGPNPTPGIFWWKQPPGLLLPPFPAMLWSSGLPFAPSLFKGGALNIVPLAARGLTLQNRIYQGYRKVSRSQDLTPAIVAGVEQEYVTFDFAPGLATGAIISSIVSLNVYSLSGNDLSPSSRILNTPSITSSPSTNGANQAVFALFGNMIAGLYLLQAIVQTSDGQTISVEARWPCVNPTP